MRKFVTLFLVFCLLLSVPAYAAEKTEYSFEGKSWETVIEEFFTEHGIDPNTLAFGYYNTVTGEEHYHNADKYMIAASVYKLPLNMYYSEMVYNGEIEWTTTYGDLTYEAIQKSSIESSNNELSEMLQHHIGSYQQYRSAIAPYCGVSTDDMNQRFFYGNLFTPRQVIHALKMLYEEPERFPRVLDYMKTACPDNFFAYSEDRYEIAHKYGYVIYEERFIYNDCAVVYTDEPILLVMFTEGCVGGVMTLARYCSLMCDYTQYQTAQRLAAEAEKAAEEGAEATPVPTAEPEATPSPIPPAMTAPPVEQTEEVEETRWNGFEAVLLALAGLLGLSLVILCPGKKRLAAIIVALVLCAGIYALFAMPELGGEKKQTGETVHTARPEVTVEPTPEPTPEVTSCTITTESAEEILALAELDSLEFIDATASTQYAALTQLQSMLTDCEIVWKVDVYGQTVMSTAAELTVAYSGDDTASLMEALAYLPALEKLDIKSMPVSNAQAEEIMAAYPEIELVWVVNAGRWRVPTDATCFSTMQAAPPSVRYTSEDFAPVFKYCTELVALDLGHNDLTDLSGISNLKKLKVLIIVDNPNISDMSPIGELSELEYLEFYLNYGVTDYSCIEKLTKMVDMNLSYATPLTDSSFLENMPNLKRAWLRGTGIAPAEWNALIAAYPEVEFLFSHPTSVSSTCGSWRANERNVAIRGAFTNWRYVTDFNSWDDITYLEGAELITVYPRYEN